MEGNGRARAAAALLIVGALVGCSAGETDPSASASEPWSPTASAALPASETASPTGTAVALADELMPGAYADVVTDDLVLRSEPEVSDESEIFPDRLNAPMSVYVAEGPVEADGYRWFLVMAFDGMSQPDLSGWAAAEGKDGEVWLQPRPAPGGPDWEVLETDAPEALSPRSSAMGADGLVYFFGWTTRDDGADASAWAFDPATLAWRELPPMPTPRTGPVVAADGDRFYVIGGAVGSTISSDDVSIVEIYDSSSGEWRSGASAPVSPSFWSEEPAFARDGQVWLFSDGIHVYTADEDSWAQASDERWKQWGVAEGPDGEVLVQQYYGAISPYDLQTATQGESIHPPGVTRFGAGLAVDADGRVFVIGGSLVPGLGATCTGFRVFDEGMMGTTLVEAYDPETRSWTTMRPLAVGLHEAAAFPTSEGILVVGRTAGRESDVVVQRLPVDAALAADDPLVAADQELVSPGGCG